jgi:hypothetical protein
MLRWRYYNVFSIKEKIKSSMNAEMNRRNFFDDRLINNWKDIVGNAFCEKIVPQKIVFKSVKTNSITGKILYCLAVDKSFLIEFPFYKNDILERLNLYFGTTKTRFVDIKIVQF